MLFKNKLLLCVSIPAVVFVIALALVETTLQRSQREFTRYLEVDQAIEVTLRDMYAQGLQMGQAMRNIVLDPANPQAYKNLKTARTQFGEAQDKLTRLAAGSEVEAATRDIQPLQEALSRQQEAVLALVHSDRDAATQLLVSAETPAWRKLRGVLLASIEQQTKLSSDAFASGKTTVNQMKTASAALTVLALLCAITFTVSLLRTVRRELGCEPSALRHAMATLSEGDLTVSLDVPRAPAGEEASVGAALNAMAIRLSEAIAEVNNSASQIRGASSEIAIGNNDLSARTEQTASNLQETASSMEELTATVKHSAEATTQANRLSDSAATSAHRGGEVMTQVVQTMHEIQDSSHRIADITSVIDGIAFQTNILALNAAVEAARAGEQGRGFAVVATEVRTLAQRSAAAAKEIKTLIETSGEKVKVGNQLVAHAGEAIQEIVQSVQRVSDIIGEINSAASEQSMGIAQVNTAVAQLDRMTQQNAALVEESTAAAHGLSEQAGKLADLVSTFRLRERGRHS